MDLNRRTAWLDWTKNGTPRGVPLNEDAIEVLKVQIGQHLRYCFSYKGQPMRADVTNTALAYGVEAGRGRKLPFS